jgi:hypothetical protein
MEMRKQAILKYKGFDINLGDRNNMEQFSSNRAAFSQVFLQGTYDPLLKKIEYGRYGNRRRGKYWNVHSTGCKNCWIFGMVISVEPQPDNIEFLKENIRLNSLTNVRVITKALYFQDEVAVSFMGKGVGGHLSKSGSAMVETISLKTIVSMLHGKEFWIKIGH